MTEQEEINNLDDLSKIIENSTPDGGAMNSDTQGDDRIARMEARIDQMARTNQELQQQNQELNRRLADTQLILANPERLIDGAGKERAPEIKIDEADFEPERMTNKIQQMTASMVAKLEKKLDTAIAEMQSRTERRESEAAGKNAMNAIQTEISELAQRKDWTIYKNRVQAKAMEFMERYGVQALAARGIKEIYRSLRYEDAEVAHRNKTQTKPEETPKLPEKPSPTPPSGSEKKRDELRDAFDEAWEAAGLGATIDQKVK